MTWARYDDELAWNRKVAWLRAQGESGIAALGLHLLANTWSRHEGMQGFLPEYMAEQLAGRTGPKLAGLLVEIVMFEAEPGGWLIHDYHEYSAKDDDGSSAAEKAAQLSKVRAEAGARGGKAKAAAKQTASKAPSKAVANGWQNPSPVPDPVPTPNTSIDRTASSSTREAGSSPTAASAVAPLTVVRSLDSPTNQRDSA